MPRASTRLLDMHKDTHGLRRQGLVGRKPWQIVKEASHRVPPCPNTTPARKEPDVTLAHRSRPYPRDIQSHAIKPTAGTQVEGSPIPVTPSHVVHMLGRDNRSQMLTSGRQNP